MSSSLHLLTRRRFGPFFMTQFLGAFNDNVFKNALVVMLTFDAAHWTTLTPGLLVNLAAGIFILPFFLFSAMAGQLADRFDKARLARGVKLFETAIMLIAAIGFWTHSLAALLGCLFLLGLHSTLFGPVKYAILPQHLRAEEIVGGNALVEMGTFASILLGTLVGGLFATLPNGPAWVAGAGLVIALAGYGASRSIPAAPAPAPELKISLNPLTETWRNLGFARSDRTIFLAILGISWFWLFGAVLLAQFPAYAHNVLGGAAEGVTLLLTAFTFGTGAGSLLCERLSNGQIKLWLVGMGAAGLSVFGGDLAFASPASALPPDMGIGEMIRQPGIPHVLTDLTLMGVCGGLFIVPLYALIQFRAPVLYRARIIAANNIMNALFMVTGALAAAALLARGIDIPGLFALLALANVATTLWAFRFSRTVQCVTV